MRSARDGALLLPAGLKPLPARSIHRAMAHPAPTLVQRRHLPALRGLLICAGLAGLGWAGAEAWLSSPRAAPGTSAPAVQTAVVPQPVPAEEAALRVLRARLREPGSADFRDVRVYDFGAPDERAVCGRVVAGRETPPGGAEFVVRVILPGRGRTGGSPLPVVEDGPNLPRATANARGRYCRTAEEPQPAVGAAGGGATAAVAAPADLRTGANAPAAPAQGGGFPTVLRRAAVGGGTAVNLRNGPGGGAAVVAVLPRGQVLDVFDRAPGGWLRVGVGEPWGWAHASLLVEGP